MQLSDDQQQALDMVLTWFSGKTKTYEPFVLTGGAGTGKSTIVSAILDALPLQKTDILMLAPTGTAVKNVQLKTPGYPAQTISSFIEKPYTVIDLIDNATGEKVKTLRSKKDVGQVDISLADSPFNPDDYGYIKSLTSTVRQKGLRVDVNVGFKFRDDIETGFKLLIIDEWGMVSQEKADVLRQLGVPFLALGDPYQLKPVGAVQNSLITDTSRTGYYHELTTTHRQAGDNPVLAVATSARQQKNWRQTARQVAGSNVATIDISKLSKDRLANLIARADVVLSASNASVRQYNALGHQHVYDVDNDTVGLGEKILFTMNTHTKDQSGAPLFTNGTLGTINKIYQEYPEFGLAHVQVLVDGQTTDIIINTLSLTDSRVSKSTLNKSHSKAVQDILAKRAYLEVQSLGGELDEIVYVAYGYAMTVHKSQGKEWANVVFDTDVPARMRSNEAPLIYTGITRAKENIIFI